jgi:integrase
VNKSVNEKPNDDAKDRLIAELKAEIERLRTRQGKALTGMLTDAKIAKLTRRGRHRDSTNLYLQVSSKAAETRAWLFGWTKNGKFLQFGLGRSWPDGTIQWAREEAQFYRLVLQDDQDPKEARKNRQENIVIASGLTKTVREVTEEWLEAKIARKAPGYAQKIKNQLKKYIYPTIGDMLIRNVDQNIILNSPSESAPNCVGLKALWIAHWPTGHDIQMYLNRIFAYGIFREYTDKNPASMSILEHLLPAHEDVHERKSHDSLPIEKIHAFVQELRAFEDLSVRKSGHPMVANLLEAAAYTGVRIGELINAQQKEIDPETKTWNVPWQHRKFGRKKKVRRPIRPIPITPSYQRALDQAATKRKKIGYPDGDEQLIFPSDKHGHIGKKIDTSTPANFIRRHWPGLKLHPHGFRSTLSDWQRTRPDIRAEWYKIQVDHNISHEAEQHYGPGLLLDDRRRMMMLYDTFVSNPPPKVTGGKVVAITEGEPRDARRRKSRYQSA